MRQITLTPREIDVLKLIAKGCKRKDIATNLSISLGRVKACIQNITDKLQLRGIAQLTKYALENSIID